MAQPSDKDILARLSPQDQLLLKPCLNGLKKLASGKTIPSTTAQEHFVRAVREDVRATTDYEKAYLRYLRSAQAIRIEERANPPERVIKTAYPLGQPLPPSLAGRSTSKPTGQKKEYDIPENEEGTPTPGFEPLGRWQ